MPGDALLKQGLQMQKLRAAQLQATAKALSFGLEQGLRLDDENRKKFLEQYAPAFEEMTPGFGGMLDTLLAEPSAEDQQTMLDALGEHAQIYALMNPAADPETYRSLASDANLHKTLDDAADMSNREVVASKLGVIRDIVNQAGRQGMIDASELPKGPGGKPAVTMAQLEAMNAGLPDNMRLSPSELGTLRRNPDLAVGMGFEVAATTAARQKAAAEAPFADEFGRLMDRLGQYEAGSQEHSLTLQRIERIANGELSEIGKLQRDAASALAAGKTKEAEQLQTEIDRRTLPAVEAINNRIADALEKGDTELADVLRAQQRKLVEAGQGARPDIVKLQEEIDSIDRSLTATDDDAERTRLQQRKGELQAAIDVKLAEKAAAGPKDELTRMQARRDELKAGLEKAPEDGKAAIQQQIDEVQAKIDRLTEPARGSEAAPPEIVKLQNARRAALDAGKTKEAGELQRQIDKNLAEKGAGDEQELTRLQERRRELMAEQVDAEPKTAKLIDREIDEIGQRIAKMTAVVGRTPEDIAAGRQAKLQADALQEFAFKNFERRKIGNLLVGLRNQEGEVSGIQGAFADAVGGLAGQISPELGQIVTKISTGGASVEDVAAFRAQARSVIAQMIPEVAGDTSGRFSEMERRVTEATLRALEPGSSKPQIMAALEEMISLKTQAADFARIRSGRAAQHDLSTVQGAAGFLEDLIRLGVSLPRAEQIARETKALREEVEPILKPGNG